MSPSGRPPSGRADSHIGTVTPGIALGVILGVVTTVVTLAATGPTSADAIANVSGERTPVTSAVTVTETTYDDPLRADSLPDGRVDVAGGAEPQPLTAAWRRVPATLRDHVADAEELGARLTLCVQAIDAPHSNIICAGDNEKMYAASVVKPALTVAALEAYGGDVDADTPYGLTVGEITDAAITSPGNHEAWLASRLSVEGPEAAHDDRWTAVNSITDRVGLTDGYMVGDFFNLGDNGGRGYGKVRASYAVRYVTELVRAGDGAGGDGAGGDDSRTALTSPDIAQHVLDAMFRQERTSKLPGRLPAGTFANKTGETGLVSHDIAVVNTTTGRYAMAAVSDGNGMTASVDALIASAAAGVVEYLGDPVPF